MYNICTKMLVEPLNDNTAPVAAPLAIAFHGSSFPRAYWKVQSKLENIKPHMAKLPAI